MAVEKLMIQMGLTDQVSKPLGKMQRQLDSLAQKTKKSFTNIGIGAAGIFAGGAAIKSSLMPAIEMDRKMGELASLGTAQDSMNALQKTAKSFAVEYGKSAVEFVEASYDIQSAIGGLKGNDLANFTKASGVLAAATKSDTKTITSYMGTMYGVFEQDAKRMGKSNWVEQVAGQTAKAVQMFKTDGSKMAQAFGTLGSSAQAMGATMSEQMAVMGMLQATMGGGESATKYTAFLSGAVKAQEKLGIQLTDSKGKMLPMATMLERIQKRLAPLKEDDKFAALKDAFGSVEAVKLIQNLMPKIGDLKKNIQELDKVKGLKFAEDMAKKQTDQWERLEQAMFVVKATIGGAVLPAFAKVAEYLSDGSAKLATYMEKYPTFTKYAGFAITAILGIGIALGVASIAAGVFGGAMAILTSPITAVIAVIAALGAGIVYFWDYIKPVLVGFYDGFVKASGIDRLFQPALEMFEMLGSAIGWVVDQIASWLPQMDAGTDSISKMASLGEMLGQAFAIPFKFIIDKLEFIMGKIRSVIDFAKSLPFMGDDDEVAKVTKQVNSTAANDGVYQPYNATAPQPTYSYLQGQKQTNVPVGGIRSQMTNNSGNVNHIAEINVIQPKENMSLTELDERLGELAHG